MCIGRQATYYTHRVDLENMCDAVRYGPFASPGTPCTQGSLLWNLEADGVIDAKMLWHGRLGWMAIGLENPGGYHNGMNGGRIVMAMPGSPLT